MVFTPPTSIVSNPFSEYAAARTEKSTDIGNHREIRGIPAGKAVQAGPLNTES